MSPEEALTKLAPEMAKQGLCLLVLFGSRARNQVHPHSDWDFGYLAKDPFDSARLHEQLMLILASDDVDLVNLGRSSALLRMRAAVEGKPFFESAEGAFRRFQYDASSFYCDIEPVLRHVHAAILDRVRNA